ADVNAGAHAVGGAELGHPHEHVDAQLLRPRQIDVVEDRVEQRETDGVALHDRGEDQERRGRDEGRDQRLLEPIEDAQYHPCLLRSGGAAGNVASARPERKPGARIVDLEPPNLPEAMRSPGAGAGAVVPQLLTPCVSLMNSSSVLLPTRLAMSL